MSANDVTGVVHIVGTVVDIGSRTRQCCAWCGIVLLDGDSALGAAEAGQDPTPPRFPPGALLKVDGNLSAVLDDDRLPSNACALTEAEARPRTPSPHARLLPGGTPTGRDAVQVIEALRQAALADTLPDSKAVLTEALRCLGFPLDELGRTIANVRASISDAGAYFLEGKLRFRIEGDLVYADAEAPR